MDHWYSDGYDKSTQVGSRMTALCSAFKSAGVTIFTVRIDPTAAACRRCCLPLPPDASHFIMLAIDVESSTLPVAG